METLFTFLPGETVYSWCAFQHALSLNLSARKTSLSLFGNTHSMRQHDLPAALARLPLLRGATSIELIRILREHTVGGFYWPFLDENRKAQLIPQIQGESDPHWRRNLCASSRSRPHEHPLRWCGQCALDDEKRHGRAYWHVEHQLPASYTCTRHDVTLFFAPIKCRSWLLVRDTYTATSITVPADSVAQLLAHLGLTVSAMDTLNICSLRHAVLIRLQDLGIVLSRRSARHERITAWFTHTAVARWCAQNQYGLSLLADGHWIARMLWRRPMSHAVLWVVLWAALGWSSHREAAVAFKDAAEGRLQNSNGQLLLFDRPRHEPADTPQHVRRAFLSSDSYANTMLKLNATRGDIVRWLEGDPALREDWRAHLKEGKQASCEAAIRKAVLGNIGIGRASLETICEAEIRWMREHAPQKLQAMLRSLPARLAVQPTLFQNFD
nr:TniQ family protein [uncultured Albidiferax sp.]